MLWWPCWQRCRCYLPELGHQRFRLLAFDAIKKTSFVRWGVGFDPGQPHQRTAFCTHRKLYGRSRTEGGLKLWHGLLPLDHRREHKLSLSPRRLGACLGAWPLSVMLDSVPWCLAGLSKSAHFASYTFLQNRNFKLTHYPSSRTTQRSLVWLVALYRAMLPQEPPEGSARH